MLPDALSQTGNFDQFISTLISTWTTSVHQHLTTHQGSTPMAPPNLSIDVFFPPTSSTPSAVPNTSPSRDGDGFTRDEINAVVNPEVDKTWRPERDYEEFEIGMLNAGPHCVCIQGRVVNLHDQMASVKKPKAAKGCIKMIVKDDTGAFTVCSISFMFDQSLITAHQGTVMVCQHGL
jgi:hypothetical protein